MYIVTNREIDKKNCPDLKFGTSPNPKGIDELRLASAQKLETGKWDIQILPEPDSETVANSGDSDAYKKRPSWKLFCQLQTTMKTEKRNCVFLAHGYNVNFESALETGWKVQELYDVEVILFSWPSRGGGEGKEDLGKDLVGTASYKRDKKIARMSAPALDRCLETLQGYIRASDIDCGQSFTFLCHSMGNYMLKSLMSSSVYNGETLLFDNIVLCCADTNNKAHAEWVDRIAHRRRIYITINENDYALAWSRRKPGDKQLARLGHYTRNLSSIIAVYFDFTDARGVGNSHGYFRDKAIKNKNVRDLFNLMLNGKRAERSLKDYDPDRKVYHIT